MHRGRISFCQDQDVPTDEEGRECGVCDSGGWGIHHAKGSPRANNFVCQLVLLARTNARNTPGANVNSLLTS